MGVEIGHGPPRACQVDQKVKGGVRGGGREWGGRTEGLCSFFSWR